MLERAVTESELHAYVDGVLPPRPFAGGRSASGTAC